MTAATGAATRTISVAEMVSVLLVAAGLVLGATVDMTWWVLFAAGAFGPPLLREAGLLRDQDEFQRLAARRAGHRAYLAGGLFLCLVTIAKQAGTQNLDHNDFPAAAALTVMVMTYFLSYVMSFWGAQRAAFRILVAFGSFWAVFVLLSEGPAGLVTEGLLALPFFLLAFTSGRWPRVTGAVLVAAAAAAYWFLRIGRVFSGNVSVLFTGLLFVLPLAACGIALLRQPDADEA